jgi:hypothetical protein
MGEFSPVKTGFSFTKRTCTPFLVQVQDHPPQIIRFLVSRSIE